MRRVAQLEAELRHNLEMELQQRGFSRETGLPMRQTQFGTELGAAAEQDTDRLRTRHPALAAD